MKLTFQGTRGNIEARNMRHRMHSSLLVAYGGKEVMVDVGEDWRESIGDLRPASIILTHAHPDHARGLRDGAPCPVYATEMAWQEMKSYPVEAPRTLAPRRPVEVCGITFEAFIVEHSIRAPAVGFRISSGSVSVFYVPDVADIPERAEALSGIALYVGDGATVTRSMVRMRGASLIGHAPIATQLAWCEEQAVRRAVFTHCGSEIVKGDEKMLASKVRALGRERGVDASIAYDGMSIVV